LCVLDVTDRGFEILELAEGVSREQVQERTGAHVHFR
jgi:acyl CoA:acetate/3-ketoacid CoA transferase beta subunit